MIGRLALRNLVLRPWRSAFLLLGYSLGVAVMVVLLSIGEALLVQARDEKLVGGGDVTVLPEGIDIEVMKTGGLGGLFFSIDHAQFIDRQLLGAPRLAPEVAAVAPHIEGKLLYARTVAGREIPVMASGEIPSRTRLVGAMPPIASGTWSDDSTDRSWRDPTPAELRDAVDHFHLPPPGARRDPTWAEWQYYNVLSDDRSNWAFVSFIVGGDISGGSGKGQVLVTLHSQGRASRRFVASVPASAVRFSTSRASLSIGSSSVTVLPHGQYDVRADAREEHGPARVQVHLVVAPTPGAYFPGTAVADGALVSGYAVPALRADATGTICVDGRCERYDRAQAYHDHNWGVWHGVTWEWGAARAGSYTVLYGRVQPPDSASPSPSPPRPLFAALFDSLGFMALFQPKEISYEDSRIVRAAGRTIHVPGAATMVDARGDDTLRIALVIEDAAASDTRAPAAGLRDSSPLAGRDLVHPFFIQMKGRMRITGRVAGRPIAGEGAGFFETYR
jgi:hypothetical protein